jgi:hypothetical protein
MRGRAGDGVSPSKGGQGGGCQKGGKGVQGGTPAFGEGKQPRTVSPRVYLRVLVSSLLGRVSTGKGFLEVGGVDVGVRMNPLVCYTGVTSSPFSSFCLCKVRKSRVPTVPKWAFPVGNGGGTVARFSASHLRPYRPSPFGSDWGSCTAKRPNGQCLAVAWPVRGKKGVVGLGGCGMRTPLRAGGLLGAVQSVRLGKLPTPTFLASREKPAIVPKPGQHDQAGQMISILRFGRSLAACDIA